MGSFEALEAQIMEASSRSAQPNEHGFMFEAVVKWWLENDPVRSAALQDVRLCPPGTVGVDLTARSRGGGLCGVQAKMQRGPVGLKDIGLMPWAEPKAAGRPDEQFDDLMLVTTASLGPNAENGCLGKGISVVARKDLLDSGVSWPVFTRQEVDRLGASVAERPGHGAAVLDEMLRGKSGGTAIDRIRCGLRRAERAANRRRYLIFGLGLLSICLSAGLVAGVVRYTRASKQLDSVCGGLRAGGSGGCNWAAMEVICASYGLPGQVCHYAIGKYTTAYEFGAMVAIALTAWVPFRRWKGMTVMAIMVNAVVLWWALRSHLCDLHLSLLIVLCAVATCVECAGPAAAAASLVTRQFGHLATSPAARQLGRDVGAAWRLGLACAALPWRAVRAFRRRAASRAPVGRVRGETPWCGKPFLLPRRAQRAASALAAAANALLIAAVAVVYAVVALLILN
jgi:hypothetical protein